MSDATVRAALTPRIRAVDNILNPARTNYVAASDTCIQCHSQGRPLDNPIEGKYYDWPVGYRVGLKLANFWKLEDHVLGKTDFYYFADGTAHKNRMQGNDFVQSVMYRRGISCFDCHDAHGTSNYAELREPAEKLCLECHGPASPNGPRTATIEATYPSQRRNSGRPMRGLPHAGDRDRRSSRHLRARAHVPVYLASRDRQIRHPKPLHVVSHQQANVVGY